MKKKILVINSDWPKEFLDSYGVEHLTILRNIGIVSRILRAIYKKLNFTERHFWDKKNWWEDCKGYDLIILLDSTKDIAYQSQMIEKTVSSGTRLVFYMLNPISYNEEINLVSDRWEKWSFSKTESIEHSFKYGETFYFKEFAEVGNNTPIKYDSVFIGLDKGRLPYLNELKAKYIKFKLFPLFIIVDNQKSLYNKTYHQRLTYSEVIKLVLMSKSVTDVVQKAQEGMTLRVMESLFFKRKLITNNTDIKFRNIYNKENIFILGEDDEEDLWDFINSPYVELEEEKVKKYEFAAWLQRLINNTEFI